MQYLKITTIVSCLICSFSSFIHAQVNGNGKLQTIQLDAKNVQDLYIDFPVQLILDNSTSAKLELIADENVLQFIGREGGGRKLRITQDKWIEPQTMVQLKGSLPQLEALEMSGYGKGTIKNFSGTRLDVNISVGSLNLEGRVEELKINTATGKIDAFQLVAQKVSAKVNGFGEIKVQAQQSLDANAEDEGLIVYQGEPELRQIAKNALITPISEYQEPEPTAVGYVTLQLKNNKGQKIDTYVRGPRQKRFSYGIPFRANQSRTETWPIGTKLFLVNKVGMRKLLYTVSEADQKKTVALF